MKQIWLAMLTSKSQSTLSLSLALSLSLVSSLPILSSFNRTNTFSLFFPHHLFDFSFSSLYRIIWTFTLSLSLSLSLLLSSALTAVQLLFGTLSFILSPKEPKVCSLLNRCFIFSVLLLWFSLYAAVYSVSYRIIRIWVLITIVIEM